MQVICYTITSTLYLSSITGPAPSPLGEYLEQFVIVLEAGPRK